MNFLNILTLISYKNNGIIETKTAEQYNISRAMLSKFCQEGKIHRIARGQYILPDKTHDELLSFSKRSSQLIFSHETALFLHGLSNRTPFIHSVTAPSNSLPSASIKANCKVYYIKPELLKLGKTELKTPPAILFLPMI